MKIDITTSIISEVLLTWKKKSTIKEVYAMKKYIIVFFAVAFLHKRITG